jgi:ABC-type sugar transport system substrate-binding protein
MQGVTNRRYARSAASIGLALTFSSLVLYSGAASAKDPAKLVIGYVTKSATNQGWIIINKGASDAAKAAGAELITVGPAEAQSLGGQLSAIEDMVNRHVDALAVAPVDSTGVAPAIRKAQAAGIPVVAVDTGVSGAPVQSFIATDNPAAARSQGQWIAQHLPPNGEVILVNGPVSQSTGRDRRDGFVDGLGAAKPNVKVYEVQTKWDQTEAQDGVEALLRAHPNVAAIANAWDGGTMGALAALKSQHEKPGKIIVIGFDGAPDVLGQMQRGWVQADVAQHLYKEGFDGISTAIKAARKEHVDARLDTGTTIVTPDNLKQFLQDNHL